MTLTAFAARVLYSICSQAKRCRPLAEAHDHDSPVSVWLLSHCTIHLIIRELHYIHPSFLFPFLISYFYFYS